MTSDKVKIEQELNKKLSRRSTARSFFKNLDISFPKIIIDFTNVEFISRSFAQEYIYQKNNIDTEIIETNMVNFVENMMNVVEEDYAETFK